MENQAFRGPQLEVVLAVWVNFRSRPLSHICPHESGIHFEI